MSSRVHSSSAPAAPQRVAASAATQPDGGVGDVSTAWSQAALSTFWRGMADSSRFQEASLPRCPTAVVRRATSAPEVSPAHPVGPRPSEAD